MMSLKNNFPIKNDELKTIQRIVINLDENKEKRISRAQRMKSYNQFLDQNSSNSINYGILFINKWNFLMF